MSMKLYSKISLIVFFVFTIIGFHTTGFSQTEVPIINSPDLDKILDDNKDQPILINVWATWCAPCREEFPDLVKLSNEYKRQVKFIGISADDVDDLKTKVIPFLVEQKAEFQNYIIKVSDPEDFINALNKKWAGAIPATFIYDSWGNQKEMLVGMQTYEQFEKAIKKVID